MEAANFNLYLASLTTAVARVQYRKFLRDGGLCMRGFLIGLGTGIALGVLFAPLSGEETRNKMVDRANTLADNARERLEQGRDRVREGIAAIRGRAERATGTEGKF
jgi:hypothetical protein